MLVITVVACSCSIGTGDSRPEVIPPGTAQVAWLPKRDGLQYCINTRFRDLAPGARSLHIESLSVYVTSAKPDEPALLAIHGRYPGWDTPGTTIYQQPFTNTNTVWVEIIHNFPLGVACVEVYGPDLRLSRYSAFRNRMLVSFADLPARGPGERATKLFRVRWGRYLPQYSPRHRPKH